jgi:hypothetical protein
MKVKYERLSDTNFYAPGRLPDLLQRLDKLQPDSPRRWGSMTVDQMVRHLNLALGHGLGFYALPDTSTPLSRSVLPFVLLHLLKRFPISAQTVPPLEVTEHYDLAEEKAQLRKILERAYATRTDADWQPHTYFGPMSRQQWGRLVMIHCHHHFQQFSC